MLSKADNDRISRVGPGTPMGEMLRELWTPAVRADALEADGAPRRVRLLGQNFVAFRATDGAIGFLDEGCPHRCASLGLARNEGNGLRCIFHGWKFDVTGQCVDAPSEPANRREAFAKQIKARSYPVREAGGLIWAYLGDRETPPDFYDFEMCAPPAEFLVRCAVVHVNWLQGMEGQLDSAHLNALHSSSIPRQTRADGGIIPLIQNDSAPRFEFIEQPYGFREAAMRNMADGTVYARIREVVLPYYSFIPGPHGEPRLVVIVVPIDDEWSAHWYYYLNPFGPVPDWYQKFALEGTTDDDDDYAKDRGDASNMWHQDRAAMKDGHFSGIMQNFTYEDFIIEESMGPIVDRSNEHLGTSDAVIVRTRRMLFKALEDHAKGKLPFGLDQDIDYRKVRALAIRYPSDTDWKSIDPTDPPIFEFEADAAE